MTVVAMRTSLINQFKNVLLPQWVGPLSGEAPNVKTFASKLEPQDKESLPHIVINVRQAEKDRVEQEIGNPYGLYTWDVHLYYLDMDEDFDDGDTRRNGIIDSLEKRLEENKRLGNLEITDARCREYVFDSDIASVTFDSSGQEGDYSFVTEMYLTVYTARSAL